MAKPTSTSSYGSLCWNGNCCTMGLATEMCCAFPGDRTVCALQNDITGGLDAIVTQQPPSAQVYIQTQMAMINSTYDYAQWKFVSTTCNFGDTLQFYIVDSNTVPIKAAVISTSDKSSHIQTVRYFYIFYIFCNKCSCCFIFSIPI